MFDSYPYSPEKIAVELFASEQRVLLFGASGIGKSTLAAQIATILARKDRVCSCIGADPGSPAFGVPGAVNLGRWQNDAWQLIDLEPLCTLDAGRFRLPLVSAVRHLNEEVSPGLVIVDAPGIVRSVAGAELLIGLVEAATIDTVLVFSQTDDTLPLENELKILSCRVIRVQAAADARQPSKRKRARLRTRLWDSYLQGTDIKTVKIDETLLTGTPPPLSAEQHWQGRQIGFLKHGRNLAMGEVVAATGNTFQIRIKDFQENFDQVLVRDAYRNRHGRLATFKPTATATLRYMPPPDLTPYNGSGKSTGPCPVVKIGDATATLVNGVFGDPLLHLRLHQQKRSVLFDLGEGNRLPARLAHQVTDVFISHAHFDHISGFLWLLRSRIGDFPACRLFGPPGLADRIASMMRGIHWDRIGEAGPIFKVMELHHDRLLGYGLQAGKQDMVTFPEKSTPDGLIIAGQNFKAWALALDHCTIPVLAYRLELPPKLNINKERLLTRNLAPGPWLGELKRRAAAGDTQGNLRLPDGRFKAISNLNQDLLKITQANSMVYATDCGDTETNRDKLLKLASGAQIFFCEAAFLDADREYAEKSGHLTTHGCGAIGQAAGVDQMVPFHFSRRYEKKLQQVYDEVKKFCPRVILPPAADLNS